jgi:Bifunctional DNA primase/polymerase, N-terminal
MNTPLRDFGHWYAARGWHISPLVPLGKIPPANCPRCRPPSRDRPNPRYERHDPSECDCIADGRWCHGLRAATTDRAVIDGWIERRPDANIAVHVGLSKLLVLDFDNHLDEPAPAKPLSGIDIDPDEPPITDGLGTFGLLCRHLGQPWPITLTSKTPTGSGHHNWFAVTDGFKYAPDAGKLGWQIDVRAGASSVIAPGSVLASGRYEVVLRQDPIELPAWIGVELERTGHLRKEPPQRAANWSAPKLTGGRAYVEKALESELAIVATCPDGERWFQLRKSAAKLGSLVGAGLLARDVVLEELTNAAEASGVSRHERKAQRTIESGIDYGAARPRTIPAPRHQGATR